jgi:hypothetical protein
VGNNITGSDNYLQTYHQHRGREKKNSDKKVHVEFHHKQKSEGGFRVWEVLQ